MFRLQAERAGGGPHLFPRVFATVEAACTYAETNIDQLAAHYGWRIRAFHVLELPSERRVTSIYWHDPDFDPDPFASLPAAPPAAPEPSASSGHVRPDSGRGMPGTELEDVQKRVRPPALPGVS